MLSCQIFFIGICFLCVSFRLDHLSLIFSVSLFFLFLFHCVCCLNFCYVTAFLDFNWPPIFGFACLVIAFAFPFCIYCVFVCVCVSMFVIYFWDIWCCEIHISSKCDLCVRSRLRFKIEVSNPHPNKKTKKKRRKKISQSIICIELLQIHLLRLFYF